MEVINVYASEQQYDQIIGVIDDKIGDLNSVVLRYENARKNLSQFIQEGDENYEKMLERIDVNVNTAKTAYTSLQELKTELLAQKDKLAEKSQSIGNTIEDAKEAAKSVIRAVLKVEDVL